MSSGAGRLPKRQAVEKPVSKFLCRPRYRFAVPEAPMDLKMKVVKLDLSQYREHQVTSLDSEHVRPLMTDELFGVRINHADTSIYRKFRKGEGLTDSDLQLLADPKGAVAQGGQGLASGTAWLRRTATPNDPAEMSGSSRKAVRNSTHGAGTRRTASGGRNKGDEGLSVTERVERSFKVAERPPVHPTKKAMKPKEILPVLPNLSLWGSRFALVQFDRDPVSGVSDYEPESAKRATLSAITVGEKKSSGNILHYYAATPATLASQGRKDGDEDDSEEAENNADYGKLHEYSFVAASTGEGACTIVLSKEVEATRVLFTPLDSTLSLKRRSGASGNIAKRLRVAISEETEKEREARDQLVRERLELIDNDSNGERGDADSVEAGPDKKVVDEGSERAEDEEDGDGGGKEEDEEDDEDEDEEGDQAAEEDDDNEEEDDATARKAAMAAELESDSE